MFWYDTISLQTDRVKCSPTLLSFFSFSLSLSLSPSFVSALCFSQWKPTRLYSIIEPHFFLLIFYPFLFSFSSFPDLSAGFNKRMKQPLLLSSWVFWSRNKHGLLFLPLPISTLTQGMVFPSSFIFSYLQLIGFLLLFFFQWSFSLKIVVWW